MTNSNSKVVPEAKEALNKFKYEVASEVGVNKALCKNKTLFIFCFTLCFWFY